MYIEKEINQKRDMNMVAIILLAGLIYLIYRDHKTDIQIDNFLKERERERNRWR